MPGLSSEDDVVVEKMLDLIVEHPTIDLLNISAAPSVMFALEMARTDLRNNGERLLFPSPFTEGTSPIPINGLIWMGDQNEMFNRLREKLDEGYRCMKMKIGAIDRKAEIKLLANMRDRFVSEELEIRVDANGAYDVTTALEVLDELAELNVHSIEQPIHAGQYEEMAMLCEKSPIPIALDEELIGVDDKERLLDTIAPQYIVLKPTLLGGFAAAQEWIRLSTDLNINWWVTSALESNIGLNAIAQWTATLKNGLPQGLGTGALFKNNIPSPISARAGFLRYDPSDQWDISRII